MNLFGRIRRAWRRLCNRCELCGHPRATFNAAHIYTFGPFCRRCNKSLLFAQMYGMGEQKAGRLR